jgi:hypothetical protein
VPVEEVQVEQLAPTSPTAGEIPLEEDDAGAAEVAAQSISLFPRRPGDTVAPIEPYPRRPTTQEPAPVASEHATSTFTAIAAAVLGVGEERIGALRAEFANTGRIQQYEYLNNLSRSVTSLETANKFAELLQREVQGMDLSAISTAEDQSAFRTQVGAAVRGLEEVLGSPITHDAVKLAHATPPNPMNDAIDKQNSLFKQEDVLGSVRQAMFGQSKSMEDIIQQEIPDAYNWVIRAIQGAATFGITEFHTAYKVNKDFDLDVGFLKQFMPGEVYTALRRRWLMLPAEAQKQEISRFTRYVLSDNNIFTDFAKVRAIENAFNNAILTGTGTRDSFGEVTTTIFPFLDATMIPSGVKFGGRMLTMTATPWLKLMGEANKDAMSNALYQGLKDSPEFAKGAYNITQPELAINQIPKITATTLDDTPDVLSRFEADELRERLEAVVGSVAREQAKLDASLISTTDQVAALEKEAEQLRRLTVGTVRPGGTTITPYADGTGADVSVLVGKSSTQGYHTLKDVARVMKNIDGKQGGAGQLSVWSSDGTVVSPLMTRAELEQAIKSGKGKMTGNFYIRNKVQHLFTVDDYMASGGGQVLDITGSVLGRMRNYIGTPSTWFDRQTYAKYLVRFSANSGLTAKLDALTTPIWKLGIRAKWNVNKALEWSADFGLKNKRNPTMKEIQQQFGGTLTPKEEKAIYSARVYHDTLYMLENSRVYKDWHAKGFQTIRSADGRTSYHGKPLDPDAAKKVTRVYDPAKNEIVDLTEAEVEVLYKAGGRVLKSELAPALKGVDEIVYHIVYNPKTAKGAKAFEIGALSRTPIKYIHGYFPRMYKDPYMIVRGNPNAKVDGKTTLHETTIHTATSRKEAEDLIKSLSAANADKGYVYRIKQDMRVRGADQTQADLEAMQMEGRLFYDERNVMPLTHANGQYADIIAPINTISRSARMISRQISTEEFSSHMLKVWDMDFGLKLRNKGVRVSIEGSKSIDDVLDVLTNAIHDHGKLALDALESFRYIQMMRGMVNASAPELATKSLYIRASELLYTIMGGTMGTKALARAAGDASALQLARELTFFMFITANPFKQFFLNAQQHLFLTALDPTYALRWQVDMMAAMSTYKMRANVIAGTRGANKLLMKQNAALMRMSEDEHLAYIAYLGDSGIMHNINIRAALGDVPSEAAQTPMTYAGAAASKVWGAASARPVRRRMERWGFDKGEQYNVLASNLLAVRFIKKKYGIKDFRKLTATQLEELTAKGIDYSSAMLRPNASRYQQGIMAVPLQFFSFQHKILTTMFFMNKAFTKTESAKLLAGQILLFGGDAVGIGPEVKKALGEMGVENPTLVDIISGGFMDFFMDESMQLVTGNEDEDSDWSGYLAPATGLRRTASRLIDTVFSTAPIETFFGVSAHGSGKLWEGIQQAKMIVDAPQGMSWDEGKVLTVLDAVAAGGLAGYSQFAQARTAKRIGYWQAANGEVSSIRARTGELVARGLLGVQPEEFETNANLLSDLKGTSPEAKKYMEALRSDAQVYYNRMRTIVNRYGDGVFSHDYFLAQAALERSLIVDSMDEHEAIEFFKEFNKLVANSRQRQDSLTVALVKAINAGGEPQEWMITEIQNSSAPEPEKQAAIRLIRTELDQARKALPGIKRTLEDTEAYFSNQSQD